MKFQEVQTKDYLTKSNLPYTDYVINPYGGCIHACKFVSVLSWDHGFQSDYGSKRRFH